MSQGWTFELIPFRLRVQTFFHMLSYFNRKSRKPLWFGELGWFPFCQVGWQPVTPGDTSTIANTSQQAVCFHRQLDKLDAWLLDMSTSGPWTKNMWFSSLRLRASEAGRTLVKACKDWERMKKDHQIIPMEVQPVFLDDWMARRWQLSWTRPALRSLTSPEKTSFTTLAWMLPPCRRGAGSRCPFPASPERCKVQVLTKALETNRHVTHLNLEKYLIQVEGNKARSLVWDPVSGVEVRGDKLKLYQRQILPAFLIHSTYSSAVARSMLDSGWDLQSKNYIENMLDSKISKGVAGILALDDLRWVW